MHLFTTDTSCEAKNSLTLDGLLGHSMVWTSLLILLPAVLCLWFLSQDGDRTTTRHGLMAIAAASTVAAVVSCLYHAYHLRSTRRERLLKVMQGVDHLCAHVLILQVLLFCVSRNTPMRSRAVWLLMVTITVYVVSARLPLLCLGVPSTMLTCVFVAVFTTSMRQGVKAYNLCWLFAMVLWCIAIACFEACHEVWHVLSALTACLLIIGKIHAG